MIHTESTSWPPGFLFLGARQVRIAICTDHHLFEIGPGSALLRKLIYLGRVGESIASSEPGGD